LSRLELLEATGALHRSGKTTDDLDSFTQIDVPDGVDPVQVLLADRQDIPDWNAGSCPPVIYLDASAVITT